MYGYEEARTRRLSLSGSGVCPGFSSGAHGRACCFMSGRGCPFVQNAAEFSLGFTTMPSCIFRSKVSFCLALNLRMNKSAVLVDVAQLGKVEEAFHFESFLVGGTYFALDASDGEFQRIRLGGGLEFAPVGMAVFVHRTDAEGVGGFGLQPFEQEGGVLYLSLIHI